MVEPQTKINPQVLGNSTPLVGGGPVGSSYKNISFKGDLAREPREGVWKSILSDVYVNANLEQQRNLSPQEISFLILTQRSTSILLFYVTASGLGS